MKKWEIEKGLLKKKDPNVFLEWWPNPFFKGATDMPLEMILEQRRKWCKAGLCPKCGEEVKKNPDGRIVCTNDGLVITDEVIAKYGDYWK